MSSTLHQHYGSKHSLEPAFVQKENKEASPHCWLQVTLGAMMSSTLASTPRLQAQLGASNQDSPLLADMVYTFPTMKFLPPGIGNNAFSWPRKKDRKPLYITPMKRGHLHELEVGEHVAFQDFDGEQWLECRGLSTGILCLDYQIPVYVFDNHNHAFYAWCEALKEGWFRKGTTLFHMDAHFDAAEPPSYEVNIDDLENVSRYTNEVLQIATYIKPAVRHGIFSEVRNLVESQDFMVQDGSPEPAHWMRQFGHHDIVINLDLDIFCDEMSHIKTKEKLRVLEDLIPKAKLMTIATSPSFIDQEKSIRMLERLVPFLEQLQ